MPLFEPEEYVRPSTVDEASMELRKRGENALVIGGGTQIYELAERGLLADITALVDLGKLGIDTVGRRGGLLEIGANVRLSTLESHEALHHQSLGALIDSLGSIHPIQVKNLATVGGAVCSSISFFDLPVALAALDAKVTVSGGQTATRASSVTDFMVDFLTTNLGPGEFATGVTLDPAAFTTSAFAKFSLTGNDWALVNCGCALKVEGGSIVSARVVFGGLSGRLLRARQTELRLTGLSADRGEHLGVVAGELGPELKEVVSDYRASADYRRKLAKVMLLQALDRALTRERSRARA